MRYEGKEKLKGFQNRDELKVSDMSRYEKKKVLNHVERKRSEKKSTGNLFIYRERGK